MSLLLLFGGSGGAVVVPPVVPPTPSGADSSGFGGGGSATVPVQRVAGRTRAKKPLAYWVGIECRFHGPVLPQFGATLTWQGAAAEAAMPSVIFTPQPRMPGAPASWTPAEPLKRLRPTVSMRCAMMGPALPQMVVQVGKVTDRHTELVLMLLAAIEAHD